MLLRFLRFCVRFFLALAALGIPLAAFHFFSEKITGMRPPKWEGSTRKKNATTTVGFVTLPNPSLQALSINQMPLGTKWFYLHAGLVWFVTLLAFCEYLV